MVHLSLLHGSRVGEGSGGRLDGLGERTAEEAVLCFWSFALRLKGVTGLGAEGRRRMGFFFFSSIIFAWQLKRGDWLEAEWRWRIL